MKSIIIIIFIALFLPIESDSKSQKFEFYSGEVLEYEVSFMGIKLGTIIIESIGSDEINGKRVYHARSLMNSYDGIPFVDLHITYNSWMDKNISYSHKFASSGKVEKNKWSYNQLDFDYDQNMVRSTTWINKEVDSRDTVQTKVKLNDGTSLFFFARKYIDYGKKVRVPTIINNGIGTTILNFRNETAYTEIALFKNPVRTIYIDGVAEWEGVYGLKGSFEGWFSDDEARIPIIAYMNVYVGKVKIELVKYHRPGWEAPE